VEVCEKLCSSLCGAENPRRWSPGRAATVYSTKQSPIEHGPEVGEMPTSRGSNRTMMRSRLCLRRP
jgi:hypothetical protein